MQFTRFIALGDSMTEGMSDEVINGNYRGWADRVADTLAKDNPDFTYMNLAISTPMQSSVESLNASVATAIVMHWVATERSK